jgi:hypothetical protein
MHLQSFTSKFEDAIIRKSWESQCLQYVQFFLEKE